MGLRRCLECRGKGYVSIDTDKVNAVSILDLFPAIRIRSGVLSAICDKCDGRGFSRTYR